MDFKVTVVHTIDENVLELLKQFLTVRSSDAPGAGAQGAAVKAIAGAVTGAEIVGGKKLTKKEEKALATAQAAQGAQGGQQEQAQTQQEAAPGGGAAGDVFGLGGSAGAPVQVKQADIAAHNQALAQAAQGQQSQNGNIDHAKVLDLVTELATSGKKAQVKAIMANYMVDTISEVPVGKLPAFYEELQKLKS